MRLREAGLRFKDGAAVEDLRRQSVLIGKIGDFSPKHERNAEGWPADCRLADRTPNFFARRGAAAFTGGSGDQVFG
jgi:hypothetical protein